MSRIVDEDLLEAVRQLVCLACASLDPQGAWEAIHDNQIRCHPHHVVSRGAGGHDLAANVMPLCFKHHREIHSVGTLTMAKRYAVVKDWLIAAGHLVIVTEFGGMDSVEHKAAHWSPIISFERDWL